MRPFSASAVSLDAGRAASGAEQAGRRAKPDALAVEQEQFDAITDQIPQRPMGVVEGTSYTFVIIAGLAFAGLLPLTLSDSSASAWPETLLVV